MGVAVARGSMTRAGLTSRAHYRPSRALRRARPAHGDARLVPAAAWWPGGARKTFFARMRDDRELIRFKVLLLASLLLLAAMLEWVA